MSNSSLVNVVGLSPFTNGKRIMTIDRITPHCIVGEFPVERLPQFFDDEGVSCNYAIAKDGQVALILDEDKNSWCSSNQGNDQRAVTIECSCDTCSPYKFNDDVFSKLIDLTVDICQRNGMHKVVYIPSIREAIAYDPPVGECQITLHRFFASKSCPGDWFVENIDSFVRACNWKLIANAQQDVKKPVSFCVHIGAFRNQYYADNMANKINSTRLLTSPAEIRYNPDSNLYEVSVGKFDTEETAKNLGKRLQKEGFSVYIKRNCESHIL